MKTHPTSLFGPIKPRKSPEQSPTQRNGNHQKPAQRIPRTSEPFAKIPESHFVLLASCKSSAAFAIYLVLYRTWCRRLQKQNPVNLDTGKLIALGYSASTVYRALKAMEVVGLVQATRKQGKSTRVFLTWLDRSGEQGSVRIDEVIGQN
jgi:hypothetical protein